MDKERLTILKAEVEAQAGEIENIYAKIEKRTAEKGIAALESVAYQLHNLYCAFEDLFNIIADAFENHIHDKRQYHTELLKRMSISIEGIRPSLLSRESYILLDNLRSFRHLFRHAYAYELDPRKVQIVVEDAAKLKAICRKDIDAFLNALIE
ncbi:MAG TPA: hypothetical protein ENG83_07275 [Nitrospirae bacterium]|nr:hypothetical protein [Nitrospirota bacterium]HDZ02694.1 hypothetical protein [Nitrospirota bacterium]